MKSRHLMALLVIMACDDATPLPVTIGTVSLSAAERSAWPAAPRVTSGFSVITIEGLVSPACSAPAGHAERKGSEVSLWIDVPGASNACPAVLIRDQPYRAVMYLEPGQYQFQVSVRGNAAYDIPVAVP